MNITLLKAELRYHQNFKIDVKVKSDMFDNKFPTNNLNRYFYENFRI